MFAFHGRYYQDNGVVNIDTSDNSDNNNILKCHTNKENCCKFQGSGGEGEWLFPNQSKVNTASQNHGFHRNRGEGVVNLNWKENARIPTGLFCCVIPNPENPEQKACIGVYPEDEGNHLPSY